MDAYLDSLDGPPAEPNRPRDAAPPVLDGVDTSGWIQTFAETFDRPGEPDWTVWDSCFGHSDPNGAGCSLPGNSERQWYINHRYGPTAAIKPWTVANGELTIRADVMLPALKPTLGYNQADAKTLGSHTHTSGLIQNKRSFSQQYGYFEIEAKMPAGRGLWPAFWLCASDGSWPPEIDVFEMLGHEPNRAYVTQHWTDTAKGHVSAHVEAWADWTTYHRIGLLWDPRQLQLYVDGKKAGGGPIDTKVHQSMYLLLNLAVGGSWPGDPDKSTPFPAEMKIRAVRAWALGEAR